MYYIIPNNNNNNNKLLASNNLYKYCVNIPVALRYLDAIRHTLNES